MRRPRVYTRWLLLVFALLVAFPLGSPRALTVEEVYCEEAVARLAECCPGFAKESVGCHFAYEPVRCDSPVQTETIAVVPDLSIDRSRCLIDASCAALVTSKACEQPKNVDITKGVCP